jgi:hypothetical protein
MAESGCRITKNKKENNMILEQLKNSPETIDFKDVIAFIDENYDFTPTKFTNGNTVNEVNQNNGSCKVFSFAKLNQLSKEETLALFGDFYRTDVLQNPEGTDHQNIRNFIEFGWNGVSFEDEALRLK